MAGKILTDDDVTNLNVTGNSSEAYLYDAQEKGLYVRATKGSKRWRLIAPTAWTTRSG